MTTSSPVCSTRITKHARATAVRGEASLDDGHRVLEVSDNGVRGADLGGGSGLTGLTDRVTALRGTLVVESPPGRGTRVVARLPCG